MKYKKINDSWVVVLRKDEKMIEKLTEFIKTENIRSGYFNAIGAVSSVELAHYNLEKKRYSSKLINRPLEIVSLMGNVAIKGREIIVHAHGCFGTDKMELYGGHLKEATVAATIEIIFNEFKGTLNKKYDEDTGLNLMELE
jgi:predicted DNA-binding protein with PD1-like motif